MTRVHNFSAGPAALPQAVLERASAEMLDYAGTGMSVMEMSHRSKAFIDIAERAEADLIELLGVPDDYKGRRTSGRKWGNRERRCDVDEEENFLIIIIMVVVV